MYEVMARRYRPAGFDGVVGQEHIAGTLKNAIARDRVAHAYMFTGGHGCGKTTMARILAKALVCEKGPTPEPCGVCPICVDVAAGRDSDVLEIDGASNNGIEQIRQLREQAAYVPTRARYKIYIIDEVHMLSDGAFNALLKTLEEPPRHVKFILATTDPHKVPDTILSRCQRFDFRLVPAGKLAAFFRQLAEQERAAISDDALEAVAANAEGSVRDGLVLLDQLLSFADGEVTRQDVEAVRGVAPAENIAGIFTAIAGADVKAALAIVDEVASRGTNVGDFLDQLISFGRDLMVFAATRSLDDVSAYGPARATIEQLGPKTPLESALLYLDILTQARTRVRSRALSNPLVALEMAVARLAGLGGVTPVADILAALDGLPNVSAAPAPAPVPVPAPAPISVPVPPPAEPPEPTTARPEPVRDTPPAPPAPQTPPPAPETRVDEEYDGDDEQFDQVMPESLARTLVPLTLDQVKTRWETLLEALSKKHPADYRHMIRIAPQAVDEDCIRLAGPALAVEAWEDKYRLGRLTETASAIFKRPVRFSFAVDSSASMRRSETQDDSGARYALSRHPAVDTIKNLFDGVIVDCRPAAPSMDNDNDNNGDDE